jgi:hypothetical protein
MNTRGRPRTSTRIFEHGCQSIDAMEFKRMQSFKPEIRYDFPPDVPDPIQKLSVSVQWSNGVTSSIGLITTCPNYGGIRYWLICPHCGRRVRKLYAGSEIGAIVCRTCYGLVYETQYRKGSKYAVSRLVRRFMG